MPERRGFETTISADDFHPPPATKILWPKFLPEIGRRRRKSFERTSPRLSPQLPTSKAQFLFLNESLLPNTDRSNRQSDVLDPLPINSVDGQLLSHTHLLEEHQSPTQSRKASSGTGVLAPQQPWDSVPRSRNSAPDVRSNQRVASIGAPESHHSYSGSNGRSMQENGEQRKENDNPRESPPPPALSNDEESDSDTLSDTFNDPEFQEELESRWILNLSMAFKEKYDREKFFITYAEKANRWLRLTVSCDYRDKPPDSLEADLKSLPYQRDKSARIYEAVRDSLPDIKFFDTVTNLELKTADKRLHVHVTEDVNEIIKYPKISTIDYLNYRQVSESDLHFDSHLSGFVYKVSVHSEALIKKEIPGPDMIDEFLYEVNALHQLRDSPSVINFQGIVTDDAKTCIKGLLISYAEKGALVDILYDHKTMPLSWRRREKWARQIISGLADIHEHGFVQGDFTLSNIVVDSDDNAQIIDINRRGCPVGWEPPEFKGPIRSGQHISMFIGVKSDLFQLGMVLWALAVMDDEPERADPPLTLDKEFSEVPSYFRKWVESCLAEDPRDRKAAKDLLRSGPREWPSRSTSPYEQHQPVEDHPFAESTDLGSFDPILAVGEQFQEDDGSVGIDMTIRGASEGVPLKRTRSRSELESTSSENPAKAVASERLQNRIGSTDPDFEQPKTGKYADTGAANHDDLQVRSDMNGHELPRQPRDTAKVTVNQAPITHAQQNTTSTTISHERIPVEETKVFQRDIPSRNPPTKAVNHEDNASKYVDNHNRRFSPPLHQDSGFSGEHDLVGDSSDVKVPRLLSPPVHQDSGFDEAVMSGGRLPVSVVSESAENGCERGVNGLN